MVETAQSRSAPSSCELDVRRTSGHSGHGLAGRRTSAGLGISSTWVTLTAPCRRDVPTQSEPVSPPPMTTTRLPFGEDRAGRTDVVAGHTTVLLNEEIHREVNALEFAAGNRKVARNPRTHRQHHGVEVAQEVFAPDVGPHRHAGAESNAFAAHLLEPRIDDALLHLEVGDPVAEKTAEAIVALEENDVVAGAGKLLRRREPRGSRPDHGHALAATRARWLRGQRTVPEHLVRDRALDRLDRDRLVSQIEHARSFARRGTNSAGHLGEIVGREEPVGGLLQPPFVHQVVPFGDQVSERTALVAERDPAVHAA